MNLTDELLPQDVNDEPKSEAMLIISHLYSLSSRMLLQMKMRQLLENNKP